MTPRRLALLSLQRRRLPTLITVLSIAISVACSGILLRLYHLSASRFDSLGRGWQAVVGAKAGGIEIMLNALNGEGPYPDFLPSVLYDSLHSAQTVHFEDGHQSTPEYLRSIAPIVYFGKWHEYRAIGTNEDFLRGLGDSPLAAGQWANAPGQIVLGSQIAKLAGVQVGDSLSLQAWVGDHLGRAELSLKVVGVLQPTASVWDRSLFSTVAQAQVVIAEQRAELAGRSIWNEHVLQYFLINLQPGGFAPLEALINKRTVGQAVLVDSEKTKLEQLTGAGKSIGLFVSVFIILLSSLSVSAMLITRFEGMSVQLAVLRAIGYARGEIARWLLWEGFLLGLAGCALGALLDGLGFPILRALLNGALPPVELVSSSLSESAVVWLVAVVATTLAIFVPLIRLYRQDVHQALKN
jgi:putative ABC transport system permease protein